ncbi:hypothetical protein STEG23_003623 [Scotinomys teguina]
MANPFGLMRKPGMDQAAGHWVVFHESTQQVSNKYLLNGYAETLTQNYYHTLSALTSTVKTPNVLNHIPFKYTQHKRFEI